MNFIPIILVLVVAVVAFLEKSKRDKQKSAGKKEKVAEPQKSLPEDRIYDHLSGRYLTLEEAENEIIKGDQYINRIKSDDEIQTHYSPEEQEVEYIVRDMIQSNIGETEDDRIFELIEHSQLYDAYEYSMNHLWEIKPDHFLGIAYVSYSHTNGQDRNHESQLFGIVQGETLRSEFNTNADIVFAELNTTRIFRIPKKITFHEFTRVKDLILANSL